MALLAASEKLWRIIDLLRRTADAGKFHSALRDGQSWFLECAKNDPHEALAAMQQCLVRVGADNRKKKLVELVVWPVMDKPAVQGEHQESPSFVWMFLIPIVLTVHPQSLGKVIKIPATGVDISSAAQALVNSSVFGDIDCLAVWPTLLRGEDFTSCQPIGCAARMVELFENGEADLIEPLSLVLDEGLPAARDHVFFMWCGARLPVGASKLLVRGELESWVKAAVVDSLKPWRAALTEDVELEVLDPVHMADAYAANSPANSLVIKRAIKNSGLLGPLQAVMLRKRFDSYMELIDDQGGLIATLQGVAVPLDAVARAVRQACEELDVEFRGAAGTAVPVSALSH